MPQESKKESMDGAAKAAEKASPSRDSDAIPISRGVALQKRKLNALREDEVESSEGNRFAPLQDLSVPSDEERAEREVPHRPSKRAKRRSRGQDLESNGDYHRAKDSDDANGGNSKPRLVFSGSHRLNSIIRLAALQHLLLYCIADDVAPSWIAVHKHAQVRKAVALMIPGLEKGMFTGEMKLGETVGVNGPSADGGGHSTAGPTGEQPKLTENRGTKDPSAGKDDGFQQAGKNPDEYLPILLEECQLHPSLQHLADMFDRVWPVKTPGDERYCKIFSPVHAMLLCSLTKSQKDDRNKQRRHLPSHGKAANDESQRTPITAFLLTNDEMHENDYPIHPSCVPLSGRDKLMERRQQNGQSAGHGWRDTLVTEISDGDVPDAEIEAGSLTAGRTVYTLDCEMCMAGGGFVLTRVSVVDWAGDLVLDELVKPEQPITNYLTPYSGITEEMLANVTTTLHDIQDRLLKLITPRTILAGHSLESDLRALKITHPYLIDTGVLYPHPSGPPLRSSLKWLSQKYLGRAIQHGHGSSGHDSVEDARATLALIQLKCERGPSFGSFAAQQESIMKRISRSRGRLEAGDEQGLGRRSGAIVDLGNPERTFQGTAPYYIGAEDDGEVVKGVQRAVQGDPDGVYIPGGGVDFVWARLRGLETARGWSTIGEKPVTNGAICSADGEEVPTKDGDGTPSLTDNLATAVSHIKAIRDSLPPCTLFIVYSGTGNAQELFRLQEMKKQFRREYAVKKWDELSVQWTDTEDQAMKKACSIARQGIAMVAIT